MAGKVFLVGSGTGDPSLITVQGSRILAEADAVFYGEGISEEFLELVRAGADKCFTGARDDRPPLSAVAVRRQIIERARRGQKVIHLLAGDPMIFGHGGDEALALAETGIELEIVPGISPALATAAFAGIPVTHGNLSGTVTVIYATRHRNLETHKQKAGNGEPGEKAASAPEARVVEGPGAAAILENATPQAEESSADAGPARAPSSTAPPEGTSSPAAGPAVSPSAPESPENSPGAEARTGHGILVRRRRPAEPVTPVLPGTPLPGVYLRKTDLMEIIEDSDSPPVLLHAIEKPLVRRREEESPVVEGEIPYPLPDWEAASRAPGTVVVIVAEKALSLAVEELLAHGRSPETPAAVIRDGASNRQQVLTSPLSVVQGLARAAGIEGDCLLILGETVTLRERMNWFENRPLFGYRVALTDLDYRAREQARRLEQEGAVARVVPLLAATLLPDAVDTLLALAPRLSRYHMIVFTSPLAVRLVLDVFWSHGQDPRKLSGPRIAAVFAATAAELARYSLQPDVLLEEVPRRGLDDRLGLAPGQRVLIPRGARARDLLPLQIRELGAEVDLVPIYDTLPDDKGIERLRALIAADAVDLIVHATSSGFGSLWETLSPDERAKLISAPAHGCTGSLTARDLQSKGIRPAFELKEPSPAALAEAIRAHLAGKQDQQQAAR